MTVVNELISLLALSPDINGSVPTRSKIDLPQLLYKGEGELGETDMVENAEPEKQMWSAQTLMREGTPSREQWTSTDLA